jgi:hypothetical protein
MKFFRIQARRQVVIQNVLLELEEKWLQWSGHVERRTEQEYQEGH